LNSIQQLTTVCFEIHLLYSVVFQHDAAADGCGYDEKDECVGGRMANLTLSPKKVVPMNFWVRVSESAIPMNQNELKMKVESVRLTLRLQNGKCVHFEVGLNSFRSNGY
jgi:hypothetical protein